jgi:hypothetical protein
VWKWGTAGETHWGTLRQVAPEALGAHLLTQRLLYNECIAPFQDGRMYSLGQHVGASSRLR